MSSILLLFISLRIIYICRVILASKINFLNTNELCVTASSKLYCDGIAKVSYIYLYVVGRMISLVLETVYK